MSCNVCPSHCSPRANDDIRWAHGRGVVLHVFALYQGQFIGQTCAGESSSSRAVVHATKNRHNQATAQHLSFVPGSATSRSMHCRCPMNMPPNNTIKDTSHHRRKAAQALIKSAYAVEGQLVIAYDNPCQCHRRRKIKDEQPPRRERKATADGTVDAVRCCVVVRDSACSDIQACSENTSGSSLLTRY